MALGKPHLLPEKWYVFALLLGLASATVLICWWSTDRVGEQEYRYMIRVSVRCSWPILLLVLVGSSARRLWPGEASSWLLRNRKFIGLAFSAAMVWQVLFIGLLIGTGAPLFPPGLSSIFIASDMVAYAILLAMTATSFDALKLRMLPSHWRFLHATGIYYIWFIYTYSWCAGMYFARQSLLDFAGYSLLFLSAIAAGGLRFSAWRAGGLRRVQSIGTGQIYSKSATVPSKGTPRISSNG